MTNHEILQADMLDILFEYRNKSYGAYVLRRYYNNRLMKSMCIALSAVLLLFLISIFGINTRSKGIFPERKGAVKISAIEIYPPKERELPTLPKKQQTVAQVKDMTIKIVPDEKAEPIPDQKDIAENAIADKTREGAKPLDLSKALINTSDSGSGKEKEKPQVDLFEPEEVQPSFPGGPEALALFFSRNLHAPAELEAGEKKVILVRFVVGEDGSITRAEIVQSGGEEYDREVLRAFRRMPKWNPAVQNGIKVATSFTQPVTFVGAE